ncbi:MAG TPA: hypothetical protein PLQ11_09515 [Beijerinckiaceae bacterium]|nr:hypothetical protein [Beijerinckiaceae bacterium]
MAEVSASPALGRIGWLALAFLAVLAAALWWRFGSAVFTELMAAAWSLCF